MNIGTRALEFDNVPSLAMPMAQELYNKYNSKSTEVLERYEQILKPKGFFDRISYLSDAERLEKHRAVVKNLLERDIEKLLKIIK